MPPATDHEVLDRLDHAVAAFLEAMTWRTPGGRVLRQGGLLLGIGADPSPVIVNSIFPVEAEVEIAAVREALRPYRDIGHVPSIWTREHRDRRLAEAMHGDGFRVLLPSMPGMILEHRLSDAAPSGIVLRDVETDDDRERWIRGNLEGFAEDESDQAALRSAFQSLDGLIRPSFAAFYAEIDGRPVGSAMAFVDYVTEIGVVGWVGTDRAFRRRGIGRAVTIAVTNAAFNLGARLLSLQSSPMGLPVYEKLGYRTVTGYGLWLPPETIGDDAATGEG